MDKISTEQKYVDISLAILRQFNSQLPFDIFVKRTDVSYTKVFTKSDQIDWDRVKVYAEKGVRVFYCRDEDYATYMLYVEKTGEKLSRSPEKCDPDEAVFFMKETATFTMRELSLGHGVKPRALQAAASFTNNSIDTLNKNPKNIIRLISLISTKPYLIKHSVMTSMFALMLAKEAGMEGNKSLTTIGMGALLHDIGVGQLDFDPEDVEILSPQQRKEVMRHPEIGKRLLDGMQSIGEDIGLIVMQHHEQPNGQGYPNRLKNHEIYYPAKIVAIADCFSSLICKRSFRDAFSAPVAIARMKEDHGKFDQKLLNSLSNIFAR